MLIISVTTVHDFRKNEKSKCHFNTVPASAHKPKKWSSDVKWNQVDIKRLQFKKKTQVNADVDKHMKLTRRVWEAWKWTRAEDTDVPLSRLPTRRSFLCHSVFNIPRLNATVKNRHLTPRCDTVTQPGDWQVGSAVHAGKCPPTAVLSVDLRDLEWKFRTEPSPHPSRAIVLEEKIWKRKNKAACFTSHTSESQSKISSAITHGKCSVDAIQSFIKVFY